MIHIIQQSCLEKIQLNTTEFKPNYCAASALCGEEFAYQIVLFSDSEQGEAVKVQRDIYGCVEIYKVAQVPVNWPRYESQPQNGFLTSSPCLMPDALIPLDLKKPLTVNRNLTVLWIAVTADFPGDYEIIIKFSTENEEIDSLFSLHVIPNQLPKQLFTNRQYIDPCSIAAYYHVPMFSSSHWMLLEKYFRLAAQHGINDIITPIFPVRYKNEPSGSGEVQLVKINIKKSELIYDFDLLDSWIVSAQKCGIKKFTFPPLFPSVETMECPLIKVTRERREEYLFSPGTDIYDAHVMVFIRKFIRKLFKHLREMNWIDCISFQTTYEPTVEYQDNFSKCISIVCDVINKHRISDVCIDRDFYDTD